MKKLFYFIALFVGLLNWPTSVVNAQGVGINPTGNNPDPSAMLDVSSSTKGTLITRMTTSQMNAINSPAVGLLIYNTDCNTFDYWNGGAWIAIGNNTGISAPGSITGNTTPCSNATGISYSILAVTNATSYNWTVPSDASIISGQGTISITVDFGVNSGNICISASDACGTSAPSCLVIALSSPPSSNTANAATNIAQTSFDANWTSSANATTYYLDVAADNAFTAFVSGYNNLNVGNVITYTITGLTCSSTYYYRVRANNPCGTGSNSNSITVVTPGSSSGSLTFNYTSSQQTWIVPACVTSIVADVMGAEGGLNGFSVGAGKGARVQSTVSVIPGETLYIYVGGAGAQVPAPGPAPGGFNGGGNGGALASDPSSSGGGASDIRQGGNSMGNRIVVAGGGGGREVFPSGGDGGDPDGYSGSSGSGGGGGGATQLSGGTGGAGFSGAGSGAAGTVGQGGNGGDGICGRAGAGGGGGYYGGGGGGGTCSPGGAGDGGGGSSFSSGTNTTFTGGFRTGNGQVIISW